MKIKRAISALVALIMIGIVFTGCSNSNNYVTVDGVGTSNSEFLFNLKASMYSVMSSSAQTQSTKAFWTTRSNGVTPFDTAVEQAVKTTTLYAVVDKKYEDYKLTYGTEQETLFNQSYQNLVSNFNSRDEYLSYLSQQGITDEDVKSILKRNVKQNQLKNYLFAQGGELYISDDDVKKYYNENYYRAKHILFLTVDTTTRTALSAEKVAQAKKDAEDTLQQLKNGADFDTLMKAKTQDPGSLTAENADGYIFTTGVMDEAFETATKNLQVGQMSDLVLSSFGYHIIKKLDINEKSAFFEDNKADILNSLKTTKYNDLLTKWTTAAKVDKNTTKIKSIDPVALLTAQSSNTASTSKSTTN